VHAGYYINISFLCIPGLFSSKDICSTRMDIDHAPANEALQAGGSFRTSTRRADTLNGKNKDLCSSRDGLYFNEHI
jgi:plant G-box-binding factor